ncbi:MAG: hypothetical protein JXR76_16320 [Deltaproteobacteria bacterium]|nr:hypothetical protein [Deltaproteobacteria bacterium]
MRRFFYTVAMLLFVFTGCSEKHQEKTDTADAISYELFATTHLIENGDAAGLTGYDEDGTLTFSLASEDAAKLAVNHVIIIGPSAKTPHGLLRQINSIEMTTDGYSVKTRACPVQRAFKSLHLSMQRPINLAASDINWDVAPGTVLSPSTSPMSYLHTDGKSLGPYTIDYYPFDGDNDHSTPEDQVHVVAGMHGELQYVFGIDFDWPDNVGDVLGGDVLPEVTAGYYVSGGAGASFSMEGTAIRDFHRKDKLAHAGLGGFAIGPLYFHASVDLMSEVTGGAKSRFEVNSSAESSFEAGAFFSTDDGGRLVPPTFESEASVSTAKATETAAIKVSVGPRIKLLLYDTVGPYASVNAFSELSADSERDASKCWNLKNGLEGEIGIELALFGETLADWGKSFTLLDKTFAEGACLQNPEAETPPDISDPAFDFWSLRLAQTSGSWVYEDKLNLTQSIDSHWLLSGNQVKTFSKITENGEILFAKRFTDQYAVFPLPMSVVAAIPTSAITIMALTSDPTGIMMLSNNGSHLWNMFPALEPQSTRGLTSIIEVADGFVISGAVHDAVAQKNDAWIFKIDKNGSLLWSKKFGFPESEDWITSLVGTDDGFVATGRSFAVSQDPADQPFAVRFNHSGDIIWKKTMVGCDSTSGLTLSDAILSRDGDYILGGSFGTGTTKAVLIKIKPDGTVGWINGFKNDTIATLGLDVKDILQLTDGGYLLSGTIWTSGSSDYLFVARTDAVGRPTWVKRLDDTQIDAAAGCALTGEGGAIVAGYSGFKSSATDTYSSIWLSRMGVKDGVLSIPSMPQAVADEGVTIIDSPCVTVIDALWSPEDFPVSFSPKEILEENIAPIVNQLRGF